MRKGRPNISEQVQISKKLRLYFERNISATFTSAITGINVKTICKYFHQWVKQISEAEGKDFFERQKNERERIILSYDNLILEEYELLDEIKNEICKFKKEKKSVPRYLLSTQNETLRNISSLMEKKGSFSMQPTIKETLEKRIEDLEKKAGL